MIPRQYISWSSLNTLGDFSPRSIEKWKDIYLYDKKIGTNRGMAFGKTMADGLEDNEATGDELLDAVIMKIPKFEIMDKVLEDENGVEIEYYDHKLKKYVKAKVPYIKDGKIKIPLLIKMDTYKKDLSAFKEYKTAQTKWTKKKVDEFGQITFYATGIFAKTGKVPGDIELVEIPTKASLDGKIECTGEINRHHTVRNMGHVLGMMVRIKKAWALINKICEEELI